MTFHFLGREGKSSGLSDVLVLGAPGKNSCDVTFHFEGHKEILDNTKSIPDFYAELQNLRSKG